MTPGDTPHHATGVVSDDPAKHAAPDAQIHFQSLRLNVAQRVKGIASIAAFGSTQGAVLAVTFPELGNANVIGTATLVAPGIAIGAFHVFEEARTKVEAHEAAFYCFGMDGERLDIWKVTHLISADDGQSDLAIYTLELASALPADSIFPVMELTTRTPAPTEELTFLGFRESDGATYRAGELPTNVSLHLLASTGKVTQTYPMGRDRLLLPSPSFEVDCATLGGMSGGPVLDRFGKVIGVLSRGLGDGPSWGLLLWPSLAWRLLGGWPAGVVNEGATLLGLRELCSIDDRDAITVNGNRASYRSWS
jgi:hypothetical protein